MRTESYVEFKINCAFPNKKAFPKKDVGTSETLPAQIPLLDETGKHLRLHEHLQKPPQALRSDCFAKGITLEG